MKYLKSFLAFLLIGIVIVFSILPSIGFDYSDIFNWEKLPEPPSKVEKLVGIFPDFYFTIVVKSKDNQVYHNIEGNSNWITESESEFVISENIPARHAMKPCDINRLMLIGLFFKDIMIAECYEMYIQYPEASGYVKIVLDQNGNIWENYTASWMNSSSIGDLFVIVLFITIVLEVIWLMSLGMGKLVIQMKNYITAVK